MIRVTHQNLQPKLLLHLQKKRKKKRQSQQAKETHNLLLSIVVFVRKSYLIAVELWTVEINNIMRIVKYEYDE